MNYTCPTCGRARCYPECPGPAFARGGLVPNGAKDIFLPAGCVIQRRPDTRVSIMPMPREARVIKLLRRLRNGGRGCCGKCLGVRYLCRMAGHGLDWERITCPRCKGKGYIR